jgi:hypothetical protein
MKTHKYKINDRVIFRHASIGSPQIGTITELTWYPSKVKQATYTAKGDNGVIYPLLMLDTESEVGNISTKETAAGKIIHRKRDIEEYKAPEHTSFDHLKLKELRELCKKNGISYYGKKAELIKLLSMKENIKGI